MKIMFRRRSVGPLCLLALFALTTGPASAAERGPVRQAAPAVAAETEARVIVKFKPDSGLMRALSAQQVAASGPQHAAALAGRLGLTQGLADIARAAAQRA